MQVFSISFFKHFYIIFYIYIFYIYYIYYIYLCILHFYICIEKSLEIIKKVFYLSLLNNNNSIFFIFIINIVPPKSAIWNYFIRNDAVAKCKICQLNVKTAGNTTNLYFHMNRSHPNIQMENLSAVSRKRKQVITYYVTLFFSFFFFNSLIDACFT